MKLLLVDNDSDTLIELRQLCDQLGFDVVTVHCSQLATQQLSDFGLVVLSGGYWYDDELKHLETYAAELELIRTASIPIIGVCLGMQLMHVAFSGHVPLLDQHQSGAREITLTKLGQQILQLPEHITVHKNHTRGVISALEHFNILGLSEGHLEIIQHKSRPLLGVQFHPEIDDARQGFEIMQRLIEALQIQPRTHQ